jgi:protein-disulfide isomerase
MSRLRVPVTQDDHIIGSENAAVTLVEYGDYECPHCGRAHQVVALLRTRFPGQLRFVFRHFPLVQIHPNAEPAAETAEFAGMHGRFWEMHDALFQNQYRLGLPLFQTLAGVLGLPESSLRNALANGDFKEKIRDDFLGGVRSGVNGTPAFFVNGERHDGSYALDDLSAAVDAHLPVNAAR